MNDGKIALIDLSTSQSLSLYEQENEEIVNFAVSPNERLIATTHKSQMIRIFTLNTASQEENESLQLE